MSTNVAQLVGEAAQGHLDDAVGVRGPATEASLRAGTPKRTTAGTPERASRSASLTSDSVVCCTTPGREAMGCGSSMPSRTNRGAIRSDGVNAGLGDQVPAAAGCDAAGASGWRGRPYSPRYPGANPTSPAATRML